MAGETSEDVEALAQDLFRCADPTGLWSSADYIIQGYFRREAARKLQQERYKEIAKST